MKVQLLPNVFCISSFVESHKGHDVEDPRMYRKPVREDFVAKHVVFQAHRYPIVQYKFMRGFVFVHHIPDLHAHPV